MSVDERSGPAAASETAPEDLSRTRPDGTGRVLEGLGVLIEPDDVAELRVLDAGRKNRTLSGYYDDLERLAEDAVKADQWKAVYVTMNPVAPALLSRAANRSREYPDTSTADHDIERRRWVLVDLDPVRPAGIASTDDEHRAAIDKAGTIADWLVDRGFPEPVLIDSGNGAYVLVRVDLENDEPARSLVERFLAVLQAVQGDDGTKIDTSVVNAARIVRVPGTWNRKGDDTAERPHRQARLLQVPEKIEPADPKLLQAVIEDAGGDPDPDDPPPASTGRFNLERFIADHLQVARDGPWKGTGHRWVLAVCPFNEEHTDTAPFIVRQPGGAIAAGCQHDSCTWKWRDLREKFDPKAGRRRGGLKGTDDRFTDSVMAGRLGDGGTRPPGGRCLRGRAQSPSQETRLGGLQPLRIHSPAGTQGHARIPAGTRGNWRAPNGTNFSGTS